MKPLRNRSAGAGPVRRALEKFAWPSLATGEGASRQPRNEWQNGPAFTFGNDWRGDREVVMGGAVAGRDEPASGWGRALSRGLQHHATVWIGAASDCADDGFPRKE